MQSSFLLLANTCEKKYNAKGGIEYKAKGGIAKEGCNARVAHKLLPVRASIFPVHENWNGSI